MNFDNKNAIKRVTPCKFLCQIIFCNVEFAQNCRKFEFSGEKSSFMVKNRVSPFSGKTSFPQNAQKKACIGLIPDKPSATVKLGRLKTSTYVVVTYRWNRLNQPVVRAKTFWKIWAFIPHIFESCAIYYTSIGLRPYFVWKLCRIILLFS